VQTGLTLSHSRHFSAAYSVMWCYAHAHKVTWRHDKATHMNVACTHHLDRQPATLSSAEYPTWQAITGTVNNLAISPNIVRSSETQSRPICTAAALVGVSRTTSIAVCGSLHWWSVICNNNNNNNNNNASKSTHSSWNVRLTAWNHGSSSDVDEIPLNVSFWLAHTQTGHSFYCKITSTFLIFMRIIVFRCF